MGKPALDEGRTQHVRLMKDVRKIEHASAYTKV